MFNNSKTHCFPRTVIDQFQIFFRLAVKNLNKLFMSSSQLSDREHRLIIDILEVAQQKYIQERDINPRAVFNLLKILSAYNQVLPRHGISATSQSRMYNYLLHLSRKYDPHGKDDWRQLIQNHRTMNSKSNTKAQSTYREGSIHNPPTGSKPPQIVQDISDISEFNADVRDARNESVPNLRLVSGSKIHTQGDISCMVERRNYFMPKRVTRTLSRSSFDNKENIPLYHNVAPGQLLSGKNTQRNGAISFIEHSTQLAPCSKTILINSSEQRTEEEQLSMRMNQRAELAYHINLQTKAFLLLKATCLIHDEARNKLRAILKFCRLKFKKRFFGLISKGVRALKEESLKKKMAYKMFQNNTKRKIFKFFKILKSLQVKQADEHAQSISKNRLGLQFIITLVAGSVFRQSQLQAKYQYFVKHSKFTELTLLWKVFAAAQPIQQLTLKSISRSMTENTQRLIFSSWKKSAFEQKFLAGDFYAKKKKIQVFQALLSHTKIQIGAKQELTRMQKVQQIKLLSDTFNTLKIQCRHRRIIRHKSQIISSINQQKTLANYMKIWKQKLRNRQKQYIALQQQKMQLEQTYQLQLKRLVFQQGFKAYWQWQIKKRSLILKAQIYRAARLKEITLKALVAKVLEKKKCEYIQSKANVGPNLTKIFQRWRMCASVQILNRSVSLMIKRIALDKIRQNILLSEKQGNIKSILKQKQIQKILFQWKRVTHQDKTELNTKQVNLQIYILKKRKFEVIRNLLSFQISNQKGLEQLTSRHPNISKHLAKNQNQRINWTSKKHLYQNLKSYYYLSKYFNAFRKYSIYHQQSIIIQNRIEQLRKYRMKKHFIKLIVLKDKKNIMQNLQNKVLQYKKIDFLAKLKLFRLRMKQQQIYKVMINQQKKDLEYSRVSFTLKLFKHQARWFFKQNFRAQTHRQTKLQQTTFLLLKSITIVCRQRRDKHQDFIKQIQKSIVKKSIAKLKVGARQIQFGKAISQLTRLRIGTLLKKKYIIRMRSNCDRINQEGSFQYISKKLSSKILFSRLRKQIKLTKVQIKIEKTLTLRAFMSKMYQRLSDRKLLHMACHHYATQLLAKGISSWMILIRQNEKYLEPTQNINNTTTESQSQSQIPSTKRHISDIINYYSK